LLHGFQRVVRQAEHVVADDVDARVPEGADRGGDVAPQVLVHVRAHVGVAGLDAGADPLDADLPQARQQVVEHVVDADVDPDVQVVVALLEQFAEARHSRAVQHEQLVGEADVADAVLLDQLVDPADDGLHGPVLDAGLAEDGVDAAVVAVVGAVERGVERDVGAADVDEVGRLALREILEALPVVGAVVLQGRQQVPRVARQFLVQVLDGLGRRRAGRAGRGPAPKAGNRLERAAAVDDVVQQAEQAVEPFAFDDIVGGFFGQGLLRQRGGMRAAEDDGNLRRRGLEILQQRPHDGHRLRGGRRMVAVDQHRDQPGLFRQQAVADRGVPAGDVHVVDPDRPAPAADGFGQQRSPHGHVHRREFAGEILVDGLLVAGIDE